VEADQQTQWRGFLRANPELAAALAKPDPVTAGLSIVIPTYNAIGTVEPLLRQLAALPEVQGGEYEVVLTDDASTDGTVEQLRLSFPGFVFVTSAHNSGFGANANRGIERATKGYVALLNTDIELVGNPFPALLEELHKHDGTLAVMPLTYNTALGKVENLQYLKPSRGLVWNADLPAAEEYTQRLQPLTGGSAASVRLDAPAQVIGSLLCGACFICPASALKLAGGFSPEFQPFYWEDVDLGFKLRCGGPGNPVGVVTNVAVIHRHSETISKAHGARKLRFLRQNQLRFSVKWASLLRLPAQGWWLLVRAAREVLRGDFELVAAYSAMGWGITLGKLGVAVFYTDSTRGG
jgi:GT2 family glycosyltransferase